MFLAWAQPKTDQGARIGNGLALPAMVRLIFAHGIFAGLVPASGGLAFIEIVLADQRLLNFLGAIGINLLLASGPRWLLL